MTWERGVVPSLHFSFKLSYIMYVTPSTDNSFDKYDEPRLHMEQLMSSSIIDFDIPMRIAIPLDDAGIRRLKDLVSLTRPELMKINRIGERAVSEIENILSRFDLYLGMPLN